MNKIRANRWLFWSVLAFFGGMIVFGITINYSKEADLTGEQVAHTDCTVLGKYDKKVARGQAHKRNYFIESSCGTFRTSEDLSSTIEVGQNYNWSATVGNWANKPTIISITVGLS